ncbi:MAG: adenylate/guanylate cyclase domain-containing protein, partial [Terriglobia bacterium]
EGAPEVSLAADIILIGQSNFAARDLHTTPFSPRLMAGMEVQATAVANLLTGHTIRRFPWFGMVLADLFTAGVVLVVFSLLRPLVAVLLSLGWVAGLVAAAVWALSVHNLWLPFAHTLVLAAGTATGAWGYRYAQERRARGQLMGFFERYVSPEVAREIWRQRDQITLAGERRTATVMFSDIRDFTQLTYHRPSTEVLEWLNEYFGIMVEVIQRHRGFLNKFLGDGLLAVFGVPLSRGEQGDARDAVAAALAMLAALEELNRKRSAAGMPPLRIGIGLHTGVLTAGTIGAADRSEYSVVGETVNLAARVETACRQLGRPLLLTEATRQLLGSQFVTQPAGTVALKGFGEPVPLYTVESPERLEGKA